MVKAQNFYLNYTMVYFLLCVVPKVKTQQVDSPEKLQSQTVPGKGTFKYMYVQ